MPKVPLRSRPPERPRRRRSPTSSAWWPQAESGKSPTERFVDRFARRYTPVVILLAVLLAFGPPVLGYLGVAWASQTPAIEWLRRGLVLLVIACPCALVISTPVTIVSGLFRATRRGILIKGGVHLESAGRIDAVALDKTGTLTTGKPRVVSVEPLAGRREDEVLEAAAALEHHSEHPLARAIVAEARRRGLPETDVADFTALRGFGVRGTFRDQTLYVGTPRLFLDSRMPISASRPGRSGGRGPAGLDDGGVGRARPSRSGACCGWPTRHGPRPPVPWLDCENSESVAS